MFFVKLLIFLYFGFFYSHLELLFTLLEPEASNIVMYIGLSRLMAYNVVKGINEALQAST